MKSRAFTLIEVMVALVIMSIIALVSVRVTTNFIRVRAGVMSSLRVYDDVERAFTVMTQDLQHALPVYATELTPGRFARIPYVFVGEDPEGSIQPWLFFLRIEPMRLGFWRPPQTVAYFFHHHQLIRRTIVRGQSDQQQDDVLLEGVQHMQVNYFVDYQLRWESTWHVGDSLDRATPSAIRVVIEINGRQITHIFSLPIS